MSLSGIFRSLAAAASLLLGLHSAQAQLTFVFQQDFENPGSPWASTGPVSFLSTSSAPVISNTDLAPIAGNTYSADFASNVAYVDTIYEGSVTSSSLGSKFGVELWVKGGTSAGQILSVGQNGSNGVGLFYNAGNYYGYSNNTDSTFGTGAAAGCGGGAINGWDHIAVVADGNSATFYLNGTAVDTYNGTVSAPDTNWLFFVGGGASTHFNGLADGVRVFTYSGTFAASSLDYATAVPEPAAAAALLSLGAFGLVLRRRRKA